MRKILLRSFHRFIWGLLVLLDVSVNHLFNGRVETISSRAYRARLSGRPWGVWLCNVLDDIDPGHCARAALDPTGGL